MTSCKLVLQFRSSIRICCFHPDNGGSGIIQEVVMTCLHIAFLSGHNLKSSKTTLVHSNLLHLSSWETCTLKTEAVYWTERSVHICYTLWINIPYDSNPLYKAVIAAGLEQCPIFEEIAIKCLRYILHI